jgi:hypothetical protein
VTAAFKLTRDQIVAFRRRTNGLDAKAPMNSESLRQAGWAGLQDSMPRAAVLSIHARVASTPIDVLDDPTLTQVWGPRYSAYAVPAVDLPIFTLSRLPDDAKGRRRAEEMADRLEAFLGDRRMKDREVMAALGLNNAIRYATTTGRIAIRWEGALAPWIWVLPRPEISVEEARREMARRYVHIFGPTTATSFAEWAGISERAGIVTFETLGDELVPVRTPVGDEWLLGSDEDAAQARPSPAAPARLLPSGDTFFLLWGRNRELLVPDPIRRPQLWTSRVWPGAVLLGGEVAGVWRRANEKIDIDAWRPYTSAEQAAIEEEARTMPLPGLKKPMSVSFAQAA